MPVDEEAPGDRGAPRRRRSGGICGRRPCGRRLCGRVRSGWPQRAQAEREHHSSLDAVFEIVDADVEVGGGIIAGALSFRLFLRCCRWPRLRRGIGSRERARTSRFAEGGGSRVGRGGSRLERVPEHRDELEPRYMRLLVGGPLAILPGTARGFAPSVADVAAGRRGPMRSLRRLSRSREGRQREPRVRSSRRLTSGGRPATGYVVESGGVLSPRARSTATMAMRR